ncbi:DUF433 domain-containing protein [Thiothrix lacustris]|uniref:DUF433 domain-containing protein n=1 Tax=Thiothrix lacustris TaxID=525917 RepID=UPI000A62C36C|nr:DUF433 domain-containing protein [Thiothrix lacustris]
MAMLTIRDLDDDLEAQLGIRSAFGTRIHQQVMALTRGVYRCLYVPFGVLSPFCPIGVIMTVDSDLTHTRNKLMNIIPEKKPTSRITMEAGKRSGKPCIRGLRIAVYDVLGWLAAGMTTPEILEDFPELETADITACLQFAANREHTLQVLIAA